VKIDEKVLDDASTENLRETFVHLRKAAEGFAAAGDQFSAASEAFSGVMAEAQGVMEKLGEAVDGVEPVLQGGGEVMVAARETVEKLGAAVGDVRGTLARVDALLVQLGSEEGVVAALTGDAGLREDLAALIANLRRHGVLFYRDSAGEEREGGRWESGPASGRRTPR